MGTRFDRVKKEKHQQNCPLYLKITPLDSLSLVAIRRHFENALVMSPQYGPRVIRWGDPQQGGGEGQLLNISPGPLHSSERN